MLSFLIKQEKNYALFLFFLFQQVTGRSFGDKDFRTGLENGILLCE
jgi:hypothetical protein